jgi:hypothetical protein
MVQTAISQVNSNMNIAVSILRLFKCVFPFSDVPGRQRTVAKLIGVAQSNVSRSTNIELSPLKGDRKRKARNDTFENLHPTVVPKVINHWVC